MKLIDKSEIRIWSIVWSLYD